MNYDFSATYKAASYKCYNGAFEHVMATVTNSNGCEVSVKAKPQYLQSEVTVTFELSSDMCSSGPTLQMMFCGISIIMVVLLLNYFYWNVVALW